MALNLGTLEGSQGALFKYRHHTTLPSQLLLRTPFILTIYKLLSSQFYELDKRHIKSHPYYWQEWPF